MSSRQRTKSIEAAQKLIPDARVTGWAIGRSGLQPTIALGAVLCALIVLAIAIFVLSGCGG